MILQNMHILQRVGDQFVLRGILIEEPPAPEFEVLEEPLLPPHRVRPGSLPDTAEPTTSVPSYHLRNASERFIITNLTQQYLARQTNAIVRQSESIS